MQIAMAQTDQQGACYAWSSPRWRDVAIVGARTPEQIEQSVAAADIRLGSNDLAEIDRIMRDAVRVGGPAPAAMP